MNTEIFNETFKLAQSVEPVRGARIAAAVVRKGKVVSFGYNHKKSHPFQAKFCKNNHAVFFHAEVHAIKNALNSVNVDDLSRKKASGRQRWLKEQGKRLDEYGF